MMVGALHPLSPIPTPPIRLVGRETEIDQLIRLLEQSDVRLVSVTGPGGIGKTRLAFEVGRRLLASYGGSVRVVLLDQLDDPRMVLSRIADVLGVPEDGSSREELVAALGGQRWLLILDNFERLADAAPDMAWLLASSERLKLLITSRVRLRLQGEYEYVTPPMPLPAVGDDSALAENQAVQLFLQTGRSVMPALALDGANGPAIAAICRQLDGVPLAIELAAARSKVLPPEAILTRLDRRLPLLTGGARDLPDRLQTMRKAIIWSYELLTPEQQRFFRHLSAFAGSFALIEAIAVGVPPAVEPESDRWQIQAIDMLGVLVDNSLLRQLEREGEPRFSMLETIREFGIDELLANGELESARDRHASYFVALAEASFERSRGADRLPWLLRLEEAHANLRYALGWLCQLDDGARAIQLAGALWPFWWWRSYPVEGRRQIEQALALPNASSVKAHHARALTGAGALAETMGDYDAAARYHEEAMHTWDVMSDRAERAHALLFRWLVALNIDDDARMEALADESLQLFDELDDRWGIATSQLELGVAAMLRDDFPTGKRVITQAIEGFAEPSDSWGLAMSEGVLGNIRTAEGDFSAAAVHLQRSLESLVALDDQWGVATVLLSIARTAAAEGDHALVALISGSIQRMHESMGALVKVPFRERYQRNLQEAERQLGRDQFVELLEKGGALTPTEAVSAVFAPTRMPASREAPAKNLLAGLSPREREVLRLVPGRTAREIGDDLFISESTVRSHIEHILNKLGLRNQKELVAYIYQNTLL